jgi:hypothetical protein
MCHDLRMPMKFTPLPALLVFPLLTACAQPPGPAGAPPIRVVAGECDAAAAQFAVGRKGDAQLLAEVKARTGALVVRMLRPDDRITMEFSSQRMNLEVDATGKVVKVRCG